MTVTTERRVERDDVGFARHISCEELYRTHFGQLADGA